MKARRRTLQGRVERQAGEWTGDTKMQVQGVARQAEGKVQNAVGKAKDAVKDALKKDSPKKDEEGNETEELDTITPVHR